VSLYRKTIPVPHKFAVAALVAPLSFLGSLAWAQTANIPVKSKAPALAGLHYVFDASESICGYLSGDNVNNPLLGQIKAAVSGKNPGIGNRIYLLKQTVKSNVDARRDIVEATADLQTQSLNVKNKATAKGAACQPFNGVASNIELIFSPNSPTQDAESVLMITDAQLVEEDREKFVQGFSTWMHDALASGKQPYAGVALVEAEFAGRYFPVSDTDPKRVKSGYQLGTHNRPLLLFWFAKSDKHLPLVQAAVSSFAPESLEKTKDAFTQHILPMPSVGLEGFQVKPDFNPPLSTLVQNKPKFEFQKYDKARADIILGSCLHTVVEKNRIVFQADTKCKDGKPLFDGVTAINVALPVAPNRLFSTSMKSGGAPGLVSFKLTSQSFGQQTFELRHVPASSAGNKVDLKAYSLDTDACPSVDAVACTQKLAAKAYQLDVLFAQLFERHAHATEHTLDALNSAKYTVELK
jgi:hypothetical protein